MRRHPAIHEGGDNVDSQDHSVARADQKRLSVMVAIIALIPYRDDAGYWASAERYIETYLEATFTHGICPQCLLKAAMGKGG